MTIDYHESQSEMSGPAKDLHRALASITEELTAVDWYNQRIDVSPDEDLTAVLLHNRNEEIEHAAMILEWLRRNVPEFDQHLRTYLFTSQPITEIEESTTEQDEAGTSDNENPADSSLGIGKARKGA